MNLSQSVMNKFRIFGHRADLTDWTYVTYLGLILADSFIFQLIIVD